MQTKQFKIEGTPRDEAALDAAVLSVPLLSVAFELFAAPANRRREATVEP